MWRAAGIGVGVGFAAVAAGDLPGFAAVFHRDATWNQILLFTMEQGRARSVDQFVGDPTAVTAFWS